MDHLHEAWWREVHLLVIGHLGGGRDQAEKAEKLMLTILKVYKPPFSWLLPFQSKIINRLASRPWRLVKFYNLGYWFPRLQWRQRIAWHLMREFELVAQGYADCGDFGRTEALTNALTAFASPRITQWVHHSFYHRLLHHLLPMLPKTLPSHDLAVNESIKALQDKDEGVRWYAAASLGQLGQGNDKVIDALLSALQDKNQWVRREAAISLGQLGQGNDKVIDALLSALQDENEWVRHNAVTSLGQLGQGNEKVIDALLLALQDENEWVRHNAVASLGQLGQRNDKVIDALVSAFQDKEEKWIRLRYSIAQSLSQLGQGKVIDLLLSTLQDENESVRSNAAESLGHQLGQGNDKAIDALLSTLQDENESVRSNAATSLGWLGQGNDKVIDALLSALQDKDEWVRYRVAISLTQLEHSSEAVIDALLDGIGKLDGKGKRWSDSAEPVEVETAESLAKKLKLSGGKYENKVLITLNQYLYLHDSEKRDDAFEVLRRVVDGKPLPGYWWRSLARRQQRWEWLKNQFTQKRIIVTLSAIGIVGLGYHNGFDHWSFVIGNVALGLIMYFFN
jgi:HEAT repeat protein